MPTSTLPLMPAHRLRQRPEPAHDVNPGGMTTVDGTLSCTPPTPATGITMAAYTNNDLSPRTGTTLFDIDSNLNQVATRPR